LRTGSPVLTPQLGSLLATFALLASGEEMPVREKIGVLKRQATRPHRDRSRRRGNVRRDARRLCPRLGLQQTMLLLWFLVTVGMIAMALSSATTATTDHARHHRKDWYAPSRRLHIARALPHTRRRSARGDLIEDGPGVRGQLGSIVQDAGLAVFDEWGAGLSGAGVAEVDHCPGDRQGAALSGQPENWLSSCACAACEFGKP
jgi:hypothetical protein